MVAATSALTGNRQVNSAPASRPAGVMEEEWLDKHAPPPAALSAPVPPPSAALLEQINLGARAFAEFNDTLARLMDQGLLETWAERNARRERDLGLPESGWTGRENAAAPAVTQVMGATPPAQAARTMSEPALGAVEVGLGNPQNRITPIAESAQQTVWSPAGDVISPLRTVVAANLALTGAPIAVSGPNQPAVVAAAPVVPPAVLPVEPPQMSPQLAEQMELGAKAFAEFNDTLARLMDYGLIESWAERNAQRERELGLPESGWTVQPQTASPNSVTANPAAPTVETPQPQGNGPRSPILEAARRLQESHAAITPTRSVRLSAEPASQVPVGEAAVGFQNSANPSRAANGNYRQLAQLDFVRRVFDASS